MENYKKDHTFYDIFLVPFAYFQQDHRLRAFKPKFAHSVCALKLPFKIYIFKLITVVNLWG